MDDLPDEVVVIILLQLEPRDCVPLFRVCRRLHGIMTSESVSRQLCAKRVICYSTSGTQRSTRIIKLPDPKSTFKMLRCKCAAERYMPPHKTRVWLNSYSDGLIRLDDSKKVPLYLPFVVMVEFLGNNNEWPYRPHDHPDKI